LGYSLSLPFDPNDDKIILSTEEDDKEYQVRIELRKPPTYSSKKINLKKGKINIFENTPISRDIISINFKFLNIDYISSSLDGKKFEKVEQDQEYDSKLKFFFTFEASVESYTTFIINFVFKDLYGISSDTLEIEVIVNPSFKWYKEWYSIIITVFAIFGGLWAIYNWLKEKKHVELWRSIKQGLRSRSGCLKAKLCCCFSKNDSNRNSSFKALINP